MTSAPPKFTPAKLDNSKSKSPSAAKKSDTNKKEEKKSSKDKKEDKKKSKGSKLSTTSSPEVVTASSSVTPASEPVGDTDKLLQDKDRELETLRSKIKKYESELRRSDDTILVQEEEIKRLTKKLEESGSSINASTSTAGGAAASEDPNSATKDDEQSEAATDQEEGSERSSSKKSSKGTPRERRSAASKHRAAELPTKSLPSQAQVILTHINLREGHQKEAFADLELAIAPNPTSKKEAQGGTLQSHAAIVSVRCAKFDKALKERYEVGKGKKAKPIPKRKNLDLRGTDVPTASRVLDYLYSDEATWLPKLKPVDLINLALAARRYSLDRLEWICENHILEIMNLENIVTFYKYSSEVKDEKIKKFSQDFLLYPETFKEFVLRKDLTNDLGMELFSELVTMNAMSAATGPVSKMDKEKLLGACPAGKIKEDFKELYQNMIYHDGTVRLDNENITFHKAILAGSSKQIFESFNRGKLTAGALEECNDFLELSKDQRFEGRISAEAFKSMLKFIYYGDVDVEPLPACLLIPFVRFYGLNELQEVCEKIIAQSVTNSKVVLKIMAVTYLAIMAAREDMRDRLRKECVTHIVSHLPEVNLSEIKNMDKEFALDLAIELLIACQKHQRQQQ